MLRWLAVPLAVLVAVALEVRLDAQELPSMPIVLAGGHVTLGGDVAVTFGPTDAGFFNYTDYDESALRALRLDLLASVNAGGHFSILADIRSENSLDGGLHVDAPRPYALYARIRPWADRAFDVQVGRIPPTFGAFARRTYASDNILIGYPLAYQYLTALRADALPASADELLRMRGRGWLATYSVGSPTPDHGVPLASVFVWDTGVQVHGATEWLEATASVTTGTISRPLFTDDNDGKQIAGRVAVRPIPGLIAGVSAAHGPFVTSSAARAATGSSDTSRFAQTAWGADLEYSRDYYLIRTETIVSDWTLPLAATPSVGLPLRSVATFVEGRYKVVPGLYLAARLDHLGFSRITGTTRTDTWDAPVTRVEAGGGLSLQRNLLLKLSYQHDLRDGGRVHTFSGPAVQLLYWF